MGRTVACANQKGGVGKTTTVVSLAASLALGGRRVLVIDSDPQGNATSGLGIGRDESRRSLYDVLVGNVGLAAARLPTLIDGLDVVPSTVGMAATEVELASVEDRERRLGRQLAAVAAEYDHILIDCPPSLGLLTVGALSAADEVLIPVQCEYYALEGLSQLMGTINLVRDHLNPALDVNGVVLTMFDPRTRLSGQVRDEVRRHLGKSVYRTVIPRSVRLAEAPSHGLPVALYRPKSKGALAYRQLGREFRRRARMADRLDALKPAGGGATGLHAAAPVAVQSHDRPRHADATSRPETVDASSASAASSASSAAGAGLGIQVGPETSEWVPPMATGLLP